ncbi:MAG: hypothetical protein J5710_01155 [Treponema sp.]|nr:hypothetical protein [Treponema sp.]
MIGSVIQLGDSFRDRPVETLTGIKKHIMFVIAESADEVLVVPMDSIPNIQKSTVQIKDSKVVTIRYPQSEEFPLSIGDYGYNEIKTPSFINYKMAQLYSKFTLQFLIKDYEIDILEPICETFLTDLREKGKQSRFLKKSLKDFLNLN